MNHNNNYSLFATAAVTSFVPPKIQNCTDETPIRKIVDRIDQMTMEDYEKEKIVLLLTGSFCPIHLHHTEMLEAAKTRMEQDQDGTPGAMILGGFLSPSHDLYVGEKLRGDSLVLNAEERLELCRLQTADSDWMDVDAWEASQDRFYDYHKVTSRLQQYLQDTLQSKLERKMTELQQLCPSTLVSQRSGSLESRRNPNKIRVVYICGADFVLRTGAHKLVNGIVVVDRPLGAPFASRRSILLTENGSITVPLYDEVDSSPPSSPDSTSSYESRVSAKERVFERLEKSYGPEWCEASRNNIWWVPARSNNEEEDISSTRIRDLLSKRQSCKGLLHPAVAQRLLEKMDEMDEIESA
ncbi:hypothetical protein BGX31_009314 [Mortierella sp. GBA43]|nr:hypothetical protein BGX31_009314 [Mortierella sp. GBA43]